MPDTWKSGRSSAGFSIWVHVLICTQIVKWGRFWKLNEALFEVTYRLRRISTRDVNPNLTAHETWDYIKRWLLDLSKLKSLICAAPLCSPNTCTKNLLFAVQDAFNAAGENSQHPVRIWILLLICGCQTSLLQSLHWMYATHYALVRNPSSNDLLIQSSTWCLLIATTPCTEYSCW